MVSKRDRHLHFGHAQVVPHKMGSRVLQTRPFNAIMCDRGHICKISCRRVDVQGNDRIFNSTEVNHMNSVAELLMSVKNVS